jgi:hypothetical protein
VSWVGPKKNMVSLFMEPSCGETQSPKCLPLGLEHASLSLSLWLHNLWCAHNSAIYSTNLYVSVLFDHERVGKYLVNVSRRCRRVTVDGQGYWLSGERPFEGPLCNDSPNGGEQELIVTAVHMRLFRSVLRALFLVLPPPPPCVSVPPWWQQVTQWKHRRLLETLLLLWEVVTRWTYQIARSSYRCDRLRFRLNQGGVV